MTMTVTGTTNNLSRAVIGSAVIVSAIFMLALPARADRIDGDWCSNGGERLSIDGPAIVTPGGTKMSGNYERHSFSYTVPVPEKDAGSRIEMSQQSEQTMTLRRHAASSNTPPLEIWKRCEATS